MQTGESIATIAQQVIEATNMGHALESDGPFKEQADAVQKLIIDARANHQITDAEELALQYAVLMAKVIGFLRSDLGVLQRGYILDSERPIDQHDISSLLIRTDKAMDDLAKKKPKNLQYEEIYQLQKDLEGVGDEINRKATEITRKQ